MPAVAIVPAVSASAPATGVTWRRYWTRLAREAGRYAPDLAVLSQAAFEPRRNVVIDRLRDDEASRDAWAGGYLYARTSEDQGSQHKILSQGYHGQFGALALADPPSVAIPNGTALEASWPLPIKRHNGLDGYADLVNEALSKVYVEARVVFEGDGTRSHSLASYGTWLWSLAQTRGIWDTRTYGSAYPNALSQAGYEIRTDGAARTLVTEATYQDGEAFELAVLVRGDRLIRTGTSWGYPTTPGCANDTDQAAVPEEWVLAIGMVKVLQKMRELPNVDPALVERKMRSWAPAAAAIVLQEQPDPMAVRGVSMIESETTGADWTREVIGT